MVDESIFIKIVAVLVLVGSFQFLVTGERAIEAFPSPGDILDGDNVDSLLDIPGLALDFIVWPFKIMDWFWNLVGFQFLEGTPSWIVFPFRIIAAAATAIVIAPIFLRILDAIGQVSPFT